MLREIIKASVMYPGISVTNHLRQAIENKRRRGWPYCPSDEGDLLYWLAKEKPDCDALEVGFATGSTAIYILSGLDSGRLVSIDYAQNEYDREGVALVENLGLSARHELIEKNSSIALPHIFESGRQFNLIFMDGWKTFDHIWVDTFFCSRMLNLGGYIVFDDARMPAVRKCISILRTYYEFEFVDSYLRVGGWKQRLWHWLSTRSHFPPYIALKKVRDIGETNAGRCFEYWKSF